ncbi:MAG TPA: beta-propeller fold lactonase family protein [Pyrinomonadaceae bacterium]|nr:beta-propeller fold lactonase family protein [Pyrinomonadaceae bacterium]
MRRLTLRALLFAAFAAAAAAGLVSSSADIRVANSPASEGKPITPAGSLVMDLTTQQPAVGALPVSFVRSPDNAGPGGGGRYLVAVNSGFGVQFDAKTNRSQQSLAVIDLSLRPPAVVQNVYFPSPQSANVGAAFSPRADAEGNYTLYVSGGFENKVWTFRFDPRSPAHVTPISPGPDTKVTADSIDVSGFAREAPTPRYNSGRAAVYPTGLALAPGGDTLFVANNLGDSLGVVHDPGGEKRLERVDLFGQRASAARAGETSKTAAAGSGHFVYPYAVVALPYPPPRARDFSSLVPLVKDRNTPPTAGAQSSSAQSVNSTWKVYVSCWNDESVAVIDFSKGASSVSYIPVGRHPTAMVWDGTVSRLYVVNSNADSVSVIDTNADREVERIAVRLAEGARVGSSPEGLALSEDGRTLYVANAHSNSVAVVQLSDATRGVKSRVGSREGRRGAREDEKRAVGNSRRASDRSSRRSVVLGFIPTGQYPSAVACVNGTVFVGNGKGTGFASSSQVVDNSGRAPNLPNERFPAGTGRGGGQGGQYSVSLVAGNISTFAQPSERELARYTQQVMRNSGLVGAARANLFGGRSPIKHVIYVIRENRSYDQVFGDLAASGDGTRADGLQSLAIFGAGEAARAKSGAAQNLTPNARALALRFGLFDRFFVNAEASPDGHNWSTAAFSTDYLDKAYRWHYSNRGRTYDFEGFNRLPNVFPTRDAAPPFPASADAEDVAAYMRRFVPYLSGSRDVTEPASLYLWDAAARAGLTYRNYGEFVGTLSEADVASIKTNKSKPYPDVTRTVSAFPTKRSLEGRHSPTFRNFDLQTPDALTVESYRAAHESNGAVDPLVTQTQTDARLRGYSRVADWLEEFRGFVRARETGRGEELPNLSIVRLPNDHTSGVSANRPTPQFYVAENDYALGRLVEAVTGSPYWKDTAVFVVEDDAQDGPDHVDCHRSVALVISAYNRPGALVHEFHNTVSFIRTLELLLGLPPMNLLDATAAPADIFRAQADLRPYRAVLPEVALDNLTTPPARDAATLYWMRRTAEQDLEHADMADPRTLNEAIWFSARGEASPMPDIARLPAFDAMRLGLRAEAEEEDQGDADGHESAPRRVEVARKGKAGRGRER